MCINKGSRGDSIPECAGSVEGGCYSRAIAGEHRAFSLVELVVVLAVLLVLAGLTLAALAGAQSKVRLTGCIQHLHQLQLGWQLYADDHGGAVPGNSAMKTGGVWRGGVESWAGPSSAAADVDPRNLETGQLWQSGILRSAEAAASQVGIPQR